ncbi:hypothetical protein [Pimelobacter simplex]|uniref:hypothetical protein n=1 Tax=Nocardioides simplex TaxID=2045 RepID=UPI0021501F88|nr:hypothetical protein [Pimelobacter simplex]UUW87412.1 hypothetical protein M0M43_16855 [Pimelobacter simplex]UUW96917.1 hypothetical protein M0M48_05500 [Pimelobacter simplex]
MTQTLATIAAEYGIDTTTARLRCEGLYTDHLGDSTALKDREASLIRAAVAR